MYVNLSLLQETVMAFNCHHLLVQISSDRGVVVMGDEENGPGAYPQRLSGSDYNSSDVSLVDSDNNTWAVHRGGGAAVPRKRADPAVVRDGNQIFIFGGRTVK